MPNRFGMGWNISDILGGLGDAISVGAGGESNYLNQVQKDRYAQGLEQFNSGDEVGGLSMLAKSGGPKMANEWSDNNAQATARRVANENTASRNAVLNQGTQAEIAAKQAEAEKEARGRYFGLLNTATPENYDQVKAMADRWAEAKGWKPDVEVPKVFTKGWAENMLRSELAPKDWASEQESRRYHDITAADRDADRYVGALENQSRVLATLAGHASDRSDRAADRPIKQQQADASTTRAANAGARSGFVVDGYKLKPGTFNGQTAKLPGGKTLTWDGKNWK